MPRGLEAASSLWIRSLEARVWISAYSFVRRRQWWSCPRWWRCGGLRSWLCFAVTASFALLLRSVRPPAWEMGVISRQKCGHKDHVSASHCPRARRALQGWPMLTQGRGHAAFCSHEKLRASVSPLVVVLALSQCCSEMPQQGNL